VPFGARGAAKRPGAGEGVRTPGAPGAATWIIGGAAAAVKRGGALNPPAGRSIVLLEGCTARPHEE